MYIFIYTCVHINMYIYMYIYIYVYIDIHTYIIGGPGKSRISLSMKHCGQTDGTDKDPNGVTSK
jgi:hypothetical protein